MPLDPRLSLLGVAPQVAPFDYGRIATTAADLRAAQQQEAIRALALAEAQQQHQQRQRFEAYLTEVLQRQQGAVGMPATGGRVPLSQIAPPRPGESAYGPAVLRGTISPGTAGQERALPAGYGRAPDALQAPAVRAATPGTTMAAGETGSPLQLDWHKAMALWPRGGLGVLQAMREYEQGNTLAVLTPMMQGVTGLRGILPTIQSQDSLDQVRTQLKNIPQVAALLPTTYSAEAIDRLSVQLMPLAEQLALEYRREELRIKRLQELREQQKARILQGFPGMPGATPSPLPPASQGSLIPAPSGGAAPRGPLASWDPTSVQGQIVAEAQRQGTDPALALTLADLESGFRFVSGDSGAAAGYFQLHEPAATDAGKVLGLAPEARYTPEGNIPLGVQYAKQVLTRGGTPDKAFALYNWGSPAYEGKGDPNYVEKAMGLYAQYQRNLQGGQAPTTAQGLGPSSADAAQLQAYEQEIRTLDQNLARYGTMAIDQDFARILTQWHQRRTALQHERTQLEDRLQEQRRTVREARRDLGTLKRQAAEDIRDSTLPEAQKAEELQVLEGLRTPEEAEPFAARAAGFEKETHQLYATDAGLFLVGMKGGRVWQIDPNAPGGKRLLTPERARTVAAAPSATGGMAVPPPVSSGPAPTLPIMPAPVPSASAPPPALRLPPRPQPQPGTLPLLPPTVQGVPPALPPVPGGVISPEQARTQGLPVPSQVPTAPPPILAFEELSPFAQDVSSPTAQPRAFGAKPSTIDQAKAWRFGNTALQAEEIVGRLEERGEYGDAFWHTTRNRIQQMSPAEAAGLGAALGGTLGLSGLGVVGTVVAGAAGAAGGVGVQLASPLLRLLDTEAQRAYFAAKLAFIGANLRYESGAAITATEFEREDQKYFPQFNDPPSVREHKRILRQTAIRGLAEEANRRLLMPTVRRLSVDRGPVLPEQEVPEDPSMRRRVTLERLNALSPSAIEHGDADMSLQFLQQSGLRAEELATAVGLQRFYAIKRRLEAVNRPR